MATSRFIPRRSALVFLGGAFVLCSTVLADEQATMSGAVCGAGYSTSYTDIDPDAATELEFTLTLTSTVKKGCRGAVTAQFGAETQGKILLHAVATCIGTGGFENACVVGTQVESTFGAGSYNFGSQQSVAREARSAVFVFGDLPRGSWKIDILANDGGDTTARIGRRSLIGTAYKGG